MKKCFLFFNLALFISIPSWGFKNSSTYIGLGIYSQNIMGRVASKDTGAGGMLGSNSYPLLLKHDWSVFGNWFFSPQLTYTPVARASAADSAKTTIMHLMLPFGKNAGSGSGQGLDWSLGPGVIRYDIKGPGGTTTLSNGTGTATFALPGRSVAIQNVTMNLGLGYGFSDSRIAMDIIIENAGSSGKRAQSLLMSYAYDFGGR